MKDLSLNMLDIAENSVKAGATLTVLEVIEEGNKLVFRVSDDGIGMTQETLSTKLQLAGCDITRSAIAKIEVSAPFILKSLYPTKIAIFTAIIPGVTCPIA